MKVTMLGTGTSQGVPVIGCECEVCTSADPRDNRLRASIMVSHEGRNVVVDAGPDFRQQMLREKVRTLDAVVFTHEHKDHVAGLDDVRAFNFLEKRDMEVYCTDRVEEALRREYHYIFQELTYPGIPKVNLNRIELEPFTLELGLKFIPIEVLHYKLPVLGFRINDFCYITDAKTVSEEERKKIRGSKVLIVNALRTTEHLSHFNLGEALAFIEDMAPEQAYLTHISHLFAKHTDIQAMLPEGVDVAFDGQVIDMDDYQ